MKCNSNMVTVDNMLCDLELGMLSPQPREKAERESVLFQIKSSLLERFNTLMANESERCGLPVPKPLEEMDGVTLPGGHVLRETRYVYDAIALQAMGALLSSAMQHSEDYPWMRELMVFETFQTAQAQASC